MFVVCDIKSGIYRDNLDAYTSKQLKVLVHAKCYHLEIMYPGYLLFIYLSLHTSYIFLHALVDLVITSCNHV